LQIPHCVYTEEKKESDIWQITKAPWELICEMASLNIDELLGVAFMS